MILLSLYIMKWSYILVMNVPQWEVNVKLVKNAKQLSEGLISVAICFEILFSQ